MLAVPARGPAEAQKIIDALGKKISTRGPATLVEGNTGGRGWLYRSGNIVVLSDEVDALARGTMLTLEARRAGADDVTAVLFPDAIARANGTDVKTAIDRFLKEMQQKQAAAAAPAPPAAIRRRRRTRCARWARRSGSRATPRASRRAWCRIRRAASSCARGSTPVPARGWRRSRKR